MSENNKNIGTFLRGQRRYTGIIEDSILTYINYNEFLQIIKEIEEYVDGNK